MSGRQPKYQTRRLQDPIEMGIFLVKTRTMSENSPAMAGARQNTLGTRTSWSAGSLGWSKNGEVQQRGVKGPS